MKNAAFLATAAAIAALATNAQAQVWAPGIVIDGEFDDWAGQVPALITDAPGNGGTGRDVIAVYLANDQNNLYVRIESANADPYDGDEYSGVDRDNNGATGFNLFGSGIGSELLVAGASLYGQNAGGFNEGAATPASVAWGPFVATDNLEYAIALNTTIPTSSVDTTPVAAFPALGQLIGFVYGDGNAGAGNVVSGSYTLATGSAATPGETIDTFDLFDTDPNAAARTRDGGATAGFTVARSNFAAGGPAGVADVALAAAHTTDATDFGLSVITRRFASPVDITGHVRVTLDVFGDPAATNKNLWIGLVDTGGTYFAVGAGFPTAAEWTTVDVGPTSGWFLQAAGDDSVLDLANIIEWRIGLQETTPAAAGTFNVAYDNLLAPATTNVTDWMVID